ncbi:MAG: class I SAM-dependent methyltransferase [Bacteroidetes bacterium]|nr:MAG: class I SAM-dependent methyltransferase [Bacteroidota bacterium]
MKKLKSVYKFLSSKHQTIHLDYQVDMKPRLGGVNPNNRLYEIINKERMTYKSILNEALSYRSSLQKIKRSDEESSQNNPTWNNGFLPGLDIIGIYTMLGKFRPKKYIEVGSGNSTKVAAYAKSELGLSTKIISIDPQPRAEIDELADEIIRKPFESIDLETILDLHENDILFIDNSHRILPNSDATVFFLEVLPYLKKGVIVHIHDIYLPFDYPQFMCDRAYSEQYGLAIALMANPGRYQCILPNYFISEDEELSSIIEPIWKHKNLEGVERHGGSFWIKIGD